MMRNYFQVIYPIKPINVILILSTVVFLTACNMLLPAQPIAATATATLTEIPTATIDWFPATPTPTQTPTPIPTPQPTLLNHREGISELLVDDNFTDESHWTNPQSASGNVAFGSQNLTLAIARENTSLISLSQHSLPTNFYLEVTIQTTLCQPDDQVGIIFWRESEGNYYRLLVNCAGQYRLELSQGGQSFVVHDWESATYMQPGAPATNQLGLYVKQGDFQLFINDAFQFEKRIAQERIGGLGFFARTISSSAMTVRFLDLQIFRVELD